MISTAAMGKLGIGMGVAGGAMGIIGGISEGVAKQQQASFNASVASNNAQIAGLEAQQAIESAKFNIKQFQKNFSKLQGSTRVAAASGGVVVNEGSSLDVLLSNASEGSVQEAMMRYEGDKAAYAKYMEQYNYIMQEAAIRASAPSDFGIISGALGQVVSIGAGAFKEFSKLPTTAVAKTSPVGGVWSDGARGR